MIAVVLITHGHFGQEMLRTAEDIVGRQEFVAALSVTSETGSEHLAKSLEDVISRFQTADGILFLVDMMGGSPCNTVLLKTRSLKAEVVTGANLYMVISSFSHRSDMDLTSLAKKVAEDAKRAIGLPRELLLKRLG